jgi:hypothetical protein
MAPLILNYGNSWKPAVNFMPPRKHPVPTEIGRWVGPSAWPEITKKGQISCPCQDSNPESSNP